MLADPQTPLPRWSDLRELPGATRTPVGPRAVCDPDGCQAGRTTHRVHRVDGAPRRRRARLRRPAARIARVPVSLGRGPALARCRALRPGLASAASARLLPLRARLSAGGCAAARLAGARSRRFGSCRRGLRRAGRDPPSHRSRRRAEAAAPADHGAVRGRVSPGRFLLPGESHLRGGGRALGVDRADRVRTTAWPQTRGSGPVDRRRRGGAADAAALERRSVRAAVAAPARLDSRARPRSLRSGARRGPAGLAAAHAA
jgi:hypothetical protein